MIVRVFFRPGFFSYQNKVQSSWMVLWSKKYADVSLLPSIKEIVERRHGEPIKFLFLPKMSLLGSQGSTEKRLVMNFELLLRAVFMLSWAKI